MDTMEATNIQISEDFPGGPVVKTLRFHCSGIYTLGRIYTLGSVHTHTHTHTHTDIRMLH